MTHPLNMAHILGAQCCDLPTSREWLRALASNLSHIRTWWVVPMVVAHLLVHVADIIAYLRRGQTAVLAPVRSGGGDYSVKATAARARSARMPSENRCSVGVLSPGGTMNSIS